MVPESPASASDDPLLGRIASALGVPVEAFFVVPEQLVFHTHSDGTRWLLTSGAPGTPTVRCMTAQPQNQICSEESISSFLSRNCDRPEGTALATLIDRVLSMHLHLDMRG